MKSNRAVIRSCNLGCTVLALVINLLPPLFIPLREAFGLTYEQLGRLILANFATQVTFDLVCGAIIDQIGLRSSFLVAAACPMAVALLLQKLRRHHDNPPV